MNESGGVLVGYELGRNTSQISYFDRSQKDAVSQSVKPGSNQYRFPTALVKGKGKGEWYFGYEAEYRMKTGEGIAIRNLLAKAESDLSLTLDGRRYAAADLLAAFFKESLGLLGFTDPVRSIKGIAVTTADLTPDLARAIRRALLAAGFSPDSCFVLTEEESFYYYGYSQKPEVWTRGMLLVRFREDGASCERMTELRARKPFSVTCTHRGDVALPRESEKRDEAFASAVREWGGSILSSGLFITGEGFSPDWAKKSIRALTAAATHVYEGDNLFVKGAAWAVYEKLEKHSFKDRIFLGEHLVRKQLSLEVESEGRKELVPLIRAGVNWYEADVSCELVLRELPEADEEDKDAFPPVQELVFSVLEMDRRKIENEKMELPGLPVRPGSCTRLLLTAVMADRETCTVTVEDLGFGESAPASGMVWEKQIPLRDEVGS